MDRRNLIMIAAILFLGINIFHGQESKEIVGLIPVEVQRDLLDLQELDGYIIMNFEELPETFTLKKPINDHSWFWSIWSEYCYTKVSEPVIIMENYDFGWELRDESFRNGEVKLTLSEMSQKLARVTNNNENGVSFTTLDENLSADQLTIKGTLYRTTYEVEKVNKRLGIVTKRFNEEVISSNGLYIATKQ